MSVETNCWNYVITREKQLTIRYSQKENTCGTIFKKHHDWEWVAEFQIAQQCLNHEVLLNLY